MKVWVLLLENVEMENSVELYSSEEKARTAFENYAKQYQKHCEFEKTSDGMSWFDPVYNSRSSYIFIYEEEVI